MVLALWYVSPFVIVVAFDFVVVVVDVHGCGVIVVVLRCHQSCCCRCCSCLSICECAWLMFYVVGAMVSPSRSWGFLIISVIVGNVLVFILIVPVEGVAYVGFSYLPF